ncbi:hypothetical protein C0J52_28278 [Blattella germanica]|nr:hypothetical protein C0J52_28278 [Blattella germanica]
MILRRNSIINKLNPLYDEQFSIIIDKCLSISKRVQQRGLSNKLHYIGLSTIVGESNIVMGAWLRDTNRYVPPSWSDEKKFSMKFQIFLFIVKVLCSYFITSTINTNVV